MSRTSKYYIPQTIERAEAKLAELYLIRDIANIDRQIEALELLRSLNPAQKTDDAQSSALGNPATLLQGEEPC